MMHKSTEYSPVLFGLELRHPCDLKFSFRPEKVLAEEDYVSNLYRKIDDIHDRVSSNIESASDRKKDQFNISAQERKFQVGELFRSTIHNHAENFHKLGYKKD